MKKMLIAATAALLCTSVPALADGHETPEMRSVAWYEVNLIKWKEGKGGRAHEIIELFNATDEALGRQGVFDLHMGTGEWDSIVAIPMPLGPQVLAWKSNPANEEWWNKFVELNGGTEKAEALWAEFLSCQLEHQRHIGHIDIDE